MKNGILEIFERREDVLIVFGDPDQPQNMTVPRSGLLSLSIAALTLKLGWAKAIASFGFKLEVVIENPANRDVLSHKLTVGNEEFMLRKWRMNKFFNELPCPDMAKQSNNFQTFNILL